MSMDGKLLGRAVEKLKEKNQARQKNHLARQAEIYEKEPRIREIDRAIKNTVIDVIGHALNHGNDPTAALRTIRDENLALQAERAERLVSLGYPMDYLDNRPICTKCNDTGYEGMSPCSCLMTLYREEQRMELSSLIKLREETFDTFNLDYYDCLSDPQIGISPRENMALIYETCVAYARRFGKSSPNLLFCGGTGLGKTFLSTCIAKVVSENGASVVYDTAVNLFSKFEAEKFNRFDDGIETVQQEIRRYLSCDLLILDDLGTEMPTAFITSALYTLINGRLTGGKKTVISTNLTLEELGRRYSPQILSRLEGEYEVLTFFGRDIRLIKKELQ